MPKKYPPLTPNEVIDILKSLGFRLDRIHGSHHQYTNDSGNLVTVDTKEKDFGPTLIKSMISQSGYTREVFYGATKKTAKKI